MLCFVQYGTTSEFFFFADFDGSLPTKKTKRWISRSIPGGFSCELDICLKFVISNKLRRTQPTSKAQTRDFKFFYTKLGLMILYQQQQHIDESDDQSELYICSDFRNYAINTHN